MSKLPVTIYHNPRCTKSRQTLALLRDREIELRVVEYNKEPPEASELTEIVRMLNVPAQQLVRDKERQQLGIPAATENAAIVEQLCRHPEIMQRPVVVANGKARIGRPPESVLEIL